MAAVITHLAFGGRERRSRNRGVSVAFATPRDGLESASKQVDEAMQNGSLAADVNYGLKTRFEYDVRSVSDAAGVARIQTIEDSQAKDERPWTDTIRVVRWAAWLVAGAVYGIDIVVTFGSDIARMVF